MFDKTISVASATPVPTVFIGGSRLFWVAKRLFDILMSLALLPLLVLTSLILLLANPIWNKGPLLFFQQRMGKNCEPITTIKFRSMSVLEQIQRGADDPIETDRITRLGHLLRKTRLDELPQILNVLFGSMSLIGPRPDFYDHAAEYIALIPEYRHRHAVRPGISGLAQTELGYAQGIEATRSKARADLHYIRHANFWMDTKLVFTTIKCVVLRSGA